MPIPSGVATKSAISDVTAVPYSAVAAPKCLERRRPLLVGEEPEAELRKRLMRSTDDLDDDHDEHGRRDQAGARADRKHHPVAAPTGVIAIAAAAHAG